LSSNSDLENNPESSKPKKKENLKQRAYLNSVTSILDYGSRVVTTLVVTPFLVSGLGSTLFGVWKVLGQFTNYTNLADIKATQVLKWAVAKDRDIIDEEELKEYVTATFILVMMILPLILIIGAIISWYSPQIANVSTEYYSIVRVATSILVLALVVNKVFEIFESVLRGMNIGFKRMGFRATVFIIGGGLQIAVVLMGYGLIALALIQVMVNLVIGVTVYVIVKRHVPWFGWGKVNFKKSLTFFKTSGWFMGWGFTNMLLHQSDKILLGYFVGPVLVTQYVITEYLIKGLKGTVGNVIHGVIPGLGKLYGAGEFGKLLKAREHLMLLTWILANSIGGSVFILNESFSHIWVGEGQFAGQFANFLIILIAVQQLFIYNDSAIIKTTLEIKHLVYLGLLSAFGSIVIILLLINNYEIIGLCVGIISGRMVMSVGYPLIVSKKLKTKFINWSKLIRPLLTTLLIGVITFWLSKMTIDVSWVSIIIYTIITSSIFACISFCFGLNKRQRMDLKHYFSRLKLLKSN